VEKDGLVFVLKGIKEDTAIPAGFDIRDIVAYTLPDVGKQYRLLIYKKIS
jgi:hypothetical protein